VRRSLPSKSPEGPGQILPSVQWKMAKFAPFGTMPRHRPKPSPPDLTLCGTEGRDFGALNPGQPATYDLGLARVHLD
jgi:hypothetical protein